MQLPELCKKCGGKCCLTHPYVTKKEFDYLVSELGTNLVDQAGRAGNVKTLTGR